jgi:hypothetical protein
LAAAATIFWGFEGSLSTEQCEALHFLSQILTTGTAQFINTPQLMSQAMAAGRTGILHSLPIHLGTLAHDLERIRVMWEDTRSRNAWMNLEPFPLNTDLLEANLMLLRTQTNRKLMEAPPHYAALLRGTWSDVMITEFADALVWPHVLCRIEQDYSHAKHSLAALSMPAIHIRSPFTLPASRGIYPVMLLVLRNALQHAAIHCLRTNSRSESEVTIEYADEQLMVKNVGQPPDGWPQLGLGRDLEGLMRLRPPLDWEVLLSEEGRYSTYDEAQARWTTIVRRRRLDA